MRFEGVPIIIPLPLTDDPHAPRPSPQAIFEIKELTVDQFRYQEWKAWIKNPPKRPLKPACKVSSEEIS